jgi:hypothetical protein
MVEWRCFDLEAPLYGGALAAEHGRIVVPQGAGLGIDPDPRVRRKLFESLEHPGSRHAPEA